MNSSRRQFIQSAAALAALGTLATSAVATTQSTGNIRQAAFEKALHKKPWLIGYASAQHQHLHSQAQVEGRIPPGLRGSLYRNGPAQHQIFGYRYNHWFDGDGMVHRYHINDSGIHHTGRMVQTAKYTKEQQARRALYPAFGSVPSNSLPLISPDTINSANISVLPHHGELLALWEAGSAYRLDSESLETKGIKRWSDDTAGLAFSAHPRIAANGELWNFGYITSASAILLWHIDTQGKLKRNALLKVDPITMPHDFLVTEKHIIIILAPFDFVNNLDVADEKKERSFLDLHSWRPEQATRVLVIDKNTLTLQTTLELPAQWVFHYTNAWEDKQGIIRFEGARANDPSLMTNYFRDVMRGEGEIDDNTPQPNLYSYRIDTRRQQIKEQQLFSDDRFCEFPSFNKQYSTQEHSMVTSLISNNKQAAKNYHHLNCVSLANIKQERESLYRYPDQQQPEEHLFVADRKAQQENAGWIIGSFLDYTIGATGLNIFAPERIEEGPIATAWLPYTLPLGLHGSFVQAD